MTTTIAMNKTDYINFVERLKKEINQSISPKSISGFQDMVARSLGYLNHADALSYFDNDMKEKEAQNFLFKRNFYYYLSLQCKTDDPWNKRVILLVQLLFSIAEYKNYKLSSRSLNRLLPLEVLIKFQKDKATPEIIKTKINEYLKELPCFENVRKINKQVKEQHQFNLPYILIACKMSENKRMEKEKEIKEKTIEMAKTAEAE